MCKLEGCTRPGNKKGFCNMHYNRWKRHGDPEVCLTNYGAGYYYNNGYKMFRNGKYDTPVYEHIQLAEKALGKKLPPGAEVHHLDNNPRNNATTNLVICPSKSYHNLLHKRGRDLGYENY